MDLFGNDNVIMKALTWKEPFASLMMHGKIETRTWNTNYRGLVLICAGKKDYSELDLIGISGDIQTQRIFNLINKKGIREHCGKAIAIGTLTGCKPMYIEDEERCFVKYRKGLYCHFYSDVTPIEPFDWKGSQGWRNVSNDIIQTIKYK